MNKISNQFASIEQVTDQYLTRKKHGCGNFERCLL